MTVDRHALLLLTGRSAVAFALLAVAVAGHSAPLLGLDSWLSSAARTLALAHPLWRAVMAAVTVTGSTAIIGPLTTAGCALLLASGRWRQAVFAAIAVGATIGVRLIVVAAVARPRPAGRLAPASNFAFPSGHSAASAAVALVFAMICLPLLRGRLSRVLLTCAAITWVFVVGLSRVALVVHWPSDVVGGWLFAVAVVSTVALLMSSVLDQEHATVPANVARRPRG